MRLYELLSPQATEITAQKYGSQIMSRLNNDTRYKKFTDPVNFLIWLSKDIDPTQNSKYTPWLLNLYLTNGVRHLEDFHKLTEPLEKYARLTQAKKIPVEYRDINKFKNLKVFLDYMDTLSDKKTSNEIKANEEQELIKSGQVEIYLNTPDIKIVIPKTQEAAMYYGRNTRWCTSAIKNNMFSEYNAFGSLYIILFKKTNTRWQFHFESAQFMDEQDNELSCDQVKSVYNLFSEELWLKAVKIRPVKIIQYIENPSEEVQLAAVGRNSISIKYIENPTIKVQLAAVKQNSDAIRYIKNPSIKVQLAAKH